MPSLVNTLGIKVLFSYSLNCAEHLKSSMEDLHLSRLFNAIQNWHNLDRPHSINQLYIIRVTDFWIQKIFYL